MTRIGGIKVIVADADRVAPVWVIVVAVMIKVCCVVMLAGAMYSAESYQPDEVNVPMPAGLIVQVDPG